MAPQSLTSTSRHFAGRLSLTSGGPTPGGRLSAQANDIVTTVGPRTSSGNDQDCDGEESDEVGLIAAKVEAASPPVP